jgi:type III secretion protein N (ATPase)
VTALSDQLTPPPQADRLARLTRRIGARRFCVQFGRVTQVHPPAVHAAVYGVRIGDICRIDRQGTEPVLAEVIGLNGDGAILTPFGSANGIASGNRVEKCADRLSFPFHTELTSRVLDGLGNLADGSALHDRAVMRAARQPAPSPLDRPLIDTRFATGLRAIDGLITLGRGQRIGIFGAPGTGKSTLLSAIASSCDADVIVFGLVGERGREVQEVLTRHLPRAKRDKVVVVTSTSDRPPMERVYSVHVATSIAEGFRDAGKSVLLVIDSMTRVARALREIGLAAGESPTRRGYPASVYPALPEIIERTGRTKAGDITAIYSVLVEGDVKSDPIAEEIRSLTDGHIELSQELAAAGHFPAIDVVQSLSRIMPDVVDKDHMQAANALRAALKKFQEVELLVQIGEYKPGRDKEADAAIDREPKIQDFLRQSGSEVAPFTQTVSKLRRIFK